MFLETNNPAPPPAFGQALTENACGSCPTPLLAGSTQWCRQKSQPRLPGHVKPGGGSGGNVPEHRLEGDELGLMHRQCLSGGGGGDPAQAQGEPQPSPSRPCRALGLPSVGIARFAPRTRVLPSARAHAADAQAQTVGDTVSDRAKAACSRSTGQTWEQGLENAKQGAAR